MAKPNTIPYADAVHGIEQAKHWPLSKNKITWIQISKKNWPFSYKFFIGLLVDSSFPEGTKVELFYKESIIPNVRNTIYMNFFYQNAVVFAVHDGSPSKHINNVGVGKKFYRKMIDHPHKHIPVPESSYGYAEPLEPMTIDELWCLFKKEANIIGDVKFEYPDSLQGRLL